MREIDQVRITLLRLVSGAVQLPEEIINEMLKAFLQTRNAAIKVQAKAKGYLLRRKPSNYMDQGVAKAFSYNFGNQYNTILDYGPPSGVIGGQVGLEPSMYYRNRNTAVKLRDYTEYQRRRTGWLPPWQRPGATLGWTRAGPPQAFRSGGAYSRNWSDVFNSLP